MAAHTRDDLIGRGLHIVSLHTQGMGEGRQVLSGSFDLRRQACKEFAALSISGITEERISSIFSSAERAALRMATKAAKRTMAWTNMASATKAIKVS